MSAQTGGDVEILTGIIQRTADVKQSMEEQDRRVQSIGSRIPMVANMDAGRILADAIGDWNQRFNLILAQLNEMNMRVIGARDELIRTGADSIQAAR